MKRTKLSHRILAMLLVVLLTVQVLPLNAMALDFGILQSVETGINLGTVNQEDAINWPIKIYDYLDDGMLFEWNDSTHTGSLPVGSNSTTANAVPYGGGAHPVVTTIGTDFTGPNTMFSTAYQSNVDTARMYKWTYIEAVDFKTPRYLRLQSGGSGSSGNFTVTSFSGDLGKTYKYEDLRYITFVYRASGMNSAQDFSVALVDSGGGWRRSTSIPMFANSGGWKAVTIDLQSYFTNHASKGYSFASAAIDFGYYYKDKTGGYRGLPSGAKFELTHIGFFDNKTEAENYGQAALEFNLNPGEYLKKSTTFTATTTAVTYPARPTYGNTTNEYVFSLNQYWKPADGSNPALDPSANGTNTYPNTSYPYAYYGMDLTRMDTAKGQYTNAYTSHSYYTWADGAAQTYKYTDDNGVTGTKTFLMDAIGVQQLQEKNGATYVRLTNSGPSRILLSKFREDRAVDDASEFKVPQTEQVNYLVLVYRGNGLSASDQYGVWAQGYDNASRSGASGSIVGNWKYAGLVSDSSTWQTASNVNPQNFNTKSGWQYLVVDINAVIGAKDNDMPETNRLARAGLYLPALTNGKSIDLAYVGYFPSQAEADAFGTKAQTYMNASPTTGTTSSVSKTWGNSRVWNTGNNKGFGMLYSTGGGNWPVTNSTKGTHAIAGGSNTTDAYGYDTWMLGYPTNQLSNTDYATNRRDPMTGEKYTGFYTTTSTCAIQETTGTTNKIYFLSASYSNDGDGTGTNGFDTEVLDFDGYQLLERVTSGIMTAGLLEGSLRTVRVDNVEYRVPVYRQETVEYIAYLLAHSLVIPKRDANGNYNSNFISGATSTQFGGVDLNGDGVIGMINLDGDSRTGTDGKECNEAKVDLATALRHCLGISLPIGYNVGTYATDYETTLGTYEETLKKDKQLIGKFETCRYSIKTAMDAAYFMLNSLFIADSFNQKQNDYYYLNMPMATVTTNNHSGDAYVFDAGFTTGKIATVGSTFTDDGTNKSAVKYSPVVNADGTGGTGTISMALDANNKTLVTGKTYFNFSISNGISWTTRFPFLPVTDAEGDYAGQTYSYYFWDDDVRTYYPDTNSYIDRNYNYVLASNGEFVYNRSDALFFEFEGDDDVYLFINGELVLDIGAAHSITSVYIDVNDYVDKAREVMAEVAKYGYTNDMPIEKFDDLISADYLDEYIYDSTTGKITGTKSVKNPYTEEEIDNFKRWARLDLVDGQICQFDFYYMERHGWGANMRIVTNMHITDPALHVDKQAYQYGQEIEYGGVIDPTASVEYSFSLTNTGNQKLYNLTFKDEVIGVTLDPVNGLTVADGRNGKSVRNKEGQALQAKDLDIALRGYGGDGSYIDIPITLEAGDDGGQTALKNLLKMMDAEGTEQGFDDAEITHAGSGLWVDATIIIRGIYYLLTQDEVKAGVLHNTVYLTATTRIKPETVGNQTLKSDGDHLVYTAGFPVHYQWAGHNIFMKMGHLLEECKMEAASAGTQLNLYHQFFSKADDLGDIYYQLCDKYGRTDGYFGYHTKFTDAGGNPGYLINYDEPGIYTFYLLLYLQSGASKNYAPSGVDAEEIAEGEYAIVRSQVYVADVEDSVYVLDYGLSTETLDLNGELFKNDYLFGRYGTVSARVMGVTGTQPTYLDPAVTANTDYCRIAFQCQNLEDGNTIVTPDGIYKVNLAIPEEGKIIGYDSVTGEYTLTGVGTMTIRVTVPDDGNWSSAYLYYWYDDGTQGPDFPGTKMTPMEGTGQFEIDIPANANNIIISNGNTTDNAHQTVDLAITPGLESHITVNEETVAVGENQRHTANITTIVEEVTIHVKAPESWDKVYLHHWHDNGESTVYPGVEMSKDETTGEYIVDENGYYVLTIHGDVTHILINNGSNEQSGDLSVYAGKEAWIEVSDTVSDTVENEDGTTTTYYDTKVKYAHGTYVVHASVPSSWNENIYIYYWHEGMTDDEMTWPGKLMTPGEFGWYTYEGVPSDVRMIIINDGNTNVRNHQTIDLSITSGMETWIAVNNSTVTVTDGYGNTSSRYTAHVTYGSESGSAGLTFTPKDFMDQSNDMWLAVSVHAVGTKPSVLAPYTNTPSINIHTETQMYKKVSVIPATVVYYEDTFDAIDYNDKDTTSANSFTHHGNGSGQLSQSIDPNQPYGQDPVYQGSENDLYSGESMTEVEIMDQSLVGTFAFTGTGFEIIGRTNAFDSASIQARVYKKGDYSADAYANYLAAAEAYVAEVMRYYDVFTAYDAANAAYNSAVNKYSAAMTLYAKAETAYNEAKTAYDLYDADVEALAQAKTELDETNAALKSAKAISDAAYEALKATSKDDAAAYAAAEAAYNEAYAAYQDALNAKNAAKTAYDQAFTAAEASKAAYNLKLDAFRVAEHSAFYAFRTYEGTRKSYEKATENYLKAIQSYKLTTQSYTVVTNLGSCSFEYYKEGSQLKAFADYLTMGDQPTAPIAPADVTTIELTAVMPTAPFVTVSVAYTQFDHGNDGGAEVINQVPVIRVNDLTLGEYVVELAGMPTFIFDENYEVVGTKSTKLYLDGVRIYQPMGPTHDAYNDKENNASFEEIRDLITNGTIGVGTLDSSGLEISSGTTTWTESMFDNDFDASDKETYDSIKVNSSADYLIQGPNNEVYMDGALTRSAIVFYVKETGTSAHELQIAVRALDYGKYYGAGGTGLNAQLQYGILTSTGYAWKNLVRVTSGTEQYYSIPYTECPMDTQGRYQIVIRAVNPQTQSAAMVSYTNLKLNGLEVLKMEGLGESTFLYYKNGVLVRPQYELVIIEDASFEPAEVIPFSGNQLKLTLTRDLTYVFVRSTFDGVEYNYYAISDPGYVNSATMYKYTGTNNKWSLGIPKGNGEITLTIKQTSLDDLMVSYCNHTYGEGVVTREPNCSATGITVYTCTTCGHIKQVSIAKNYDHNYEGMVCTRCGQAEPKFYLVGYINGANYGFDNDYQNMGQYQFVDGKLTVTFQKDSYVFLKTEGNKAWYMTQEYVTGNTATFYDTATGAMEKMYVPCNIELEFRLVLNDDGSVTLTYSEPCKHEWDAGRVVVNATCTEDGEMSYTCTLCNEIKTVLLPATGHNYSGGYCTGCGEEQIRTIYFHNTAGWENVYIWAWDAVGNNYFPQWPGELMNPVEGEQDVFSYELPGYFTNVLITNNGSDSERTGDQVVPEDGRNMYDYALGNWTVHDGSLDYYLVGYINGVDYGCGNNSANMGNYKFVDGKLVVTFQSDSYVLIKSTGNVGWYMAQQYCDTYATTLYNSNTGAVEKMFVPGGMELTFTLVNNGDDTFHLSVHAWLHVVSKEATCTETGEESYTCLLCNETHKETIPALGHSFDADNICTVCGEGETRTIYFKNTFGWEEVYIYAWVEGGEKYTGEWPGTQMTPVEGETDLYSYELTTKARSVIFSNEYGIQTDNQTIPTDGRNKYTYYANTWTTLDEDVEVVVPEQQTIYLQPNDNWNLDGARFAAYFFIEGGSSVWVDMTDADGDGIYECLVPRGFAKVILCRMNPGTTENNWDNKWNQTGNLDVPTDDKNLCTINDGEWDCGENVTWSVFAPVEPGCEHSYDAVVTDPTCTEAGYTTHTCSKCGDSYTDGATEATGHSYVDGTCENCGEADPSAPVNTITVYFQNNWLWTDVKVYYWDANGSNATWPGAEATFYANDGTYDIYCVTMPEGAKVIFSGTKNDGSGDTDKTPDIEGVQDGDCYWMTWDNGNAVQKDNINNVYQTACEHSYTESVTTAAGCTTAGVKTYTCSKCSDSYTEAIAATGHSYTASVTAPTCTEAGYTTHTCSGCSDCYTDSATEATGHSYVNGTCENCGEAEPVTYMTVYFRNNWLWTNINAYYWNANGELVSWPGASVTYYDNDGTYDIYSITIPAGCSVIFNGTKNDGSDTDKSPDITDAYDGACYSMTWNGQNAVEVADIDEIMKVANCTHSYTASITTAAGCLTDGVTTYTCSNCGHSYTETVTATGHSYVNGTCENCGEAEPTQELVLYLKPNSNWLEANARFAAYFFNNSAGTNTWVGMTDANGDGYYECVVPDGYPNVIFCRMNPSTTENNWNNKWGQTGDLTVPTDGTTNLCTITDGSWDASSWSTYSATLSLRRVRSLAATTTQSAEPELIVAGDEESALNLYAVNQQMSSEVVFGVYDQIVEDVTDVKVVINSAAPELTDDINLRYHVTVSDNAQNVYMTFAFNGTTTTVTDYVRMEDGKLCFTFQGINATQIGDSIDATLYATVDGVQYTDTVAGYSVRKYSANVLARGVADEKVVTLISDMLVYGAKAQVYANYKTHALVTDGMELTPSTFTGLDESFNKLSVQGQADANVRYSAATLVLYGKMTMRLTVQTADPSAYTYKVMVNGVEYVYTAEDLVEAGNGKYYLYFDQLKATCFNDTITATIEENGQQISQVLTYSVNTYVQRYQNTADAATRELLEAIYNYGRSAENYVG